MIFVVVRQYTDDGEAAVYRIGHDCSEDESSNGYVRLLANEFFVYGIGKIKNEFATKQEAEAIIDRIEKRVMEV